LYPWTRSASVNVGSSSVWARKIQARSTSNLRLQRKRTLIVVEHGGAVHGGAGVPRAELVEAVEHRTVVADVEVVQTFRETLVNEK